jgi:hypothetical protein
VLCLQHKYELKQVTWHAKGDYFTTLNPQSNKTAILVHQLSKFTTQVHALVRACACVSCVRESNCVPETFSAEPIFKKQKRCAERALPSHTGAFALESHANIFGA